MLKDTENKKAPDLTRAFVYSNINLDLCLAKGKKLEPQTYFLKWG
jgi:hypothetical protein